MDKSKLRYIIGVVLGNADDGSVDRESQLILEKRGYKTLVFPKISTAVLSEFPTYTTLSILFAIKYVYPKFMQFFQVN